MTETIAKTTEVTGKPDAGGAAGMAADRKPAEDKRPEADRRPAADRRPKAATVIIPNYNGMRFLPDCIHALENQTTDDFEILVVDNGSADGSAAWLSENGIRTVLLSENKGFAGGVNAGIRAAGTEFVILLNNDTKVLPDFAEELIQSIRKSPKRFSCSAMMIKESDHGLIDSAGDGLTVSGWAFQRGIDEPVEKFSKSRKVFSSCAGAAIYRREVLERIGLFDEMHFAYLEDMDISYRAKLAGYYNYYCPRAMVYHLGSATSGSKYNPFKVRISARNNIYLMFKNQPDLQLLINFLPLLAGTLVKAGFFLKIGFLKEYLEGILEGLRTCGKCTRAPRAKYGLLTYLAIEWELLAGMAEYTINFIRRHCK